MFNEWFLVLLIWGSPTDAIVHGVFGSKEECDSARVELHLESLLRSKQTKNRLACLPADYE